MAGLLVGCTTSVTGTGTPTGQATGPATTSSAPPPAVLVAAGDIACAPGEDGGPESCAQEVTALVVDGLQPDAVLALGDTQYEQGSAEEFSSYEASWGRHLDKTYPVIGNHEYLGNGPNGYFDYFGDRAGKRDEGWYTATVGDWRLLVLNSECEHVGGCGVDSPQGAWLAAELAAGTPRCTLAAWHSARFSSGDEHGDNPAVAPLWTQLQAAGVDVVLTGHDHDYERFAAQDAAGRADPAGIVQFVVGTGGRSLRGFNDPDPNSEARWSDSFGVLALTLRPDGYDWRFVGPPGTREVDSGTGTCR